MVTKRKPPKQNNEQGAPGKPARPSVKDKAVARPEAAAAASNDAAANAVNQAGSQAAAQGKPKRRIAMPQSSTRLKQNQAANQSAPAQTGETGAARPAGQPTSRTAGASGSQPAGPSAGPSAPQPARPSVSQPSRPSVTKRGGGKAGGTGKPTKARKPLGVPSVQPGGSAPASAPGESAASAERASAAEGKGAALKRRLKRFSVAKAEKTASDQAKQMEGTVSAADAEHAKDAARAAIAGEAAKRRLERRQRMLKRTGEGADAAAQGVAEGDAAQGQETGDGSQVGEGARKLPFNLPELHLTWPVVAVLVAIAVVVVTVGSFSWGRWLRYDDAADFQGAWYANGTTSLVTVDGQEIHLTSDVAYGYTLDTGAKTIRFTFGDLQGQGRYRFSADRSELVIADGDGFSFWGNLFSDIGWQFGQLITGLQGKEAPREEAVDGVTVLDRTPGEGAVAAPASSAPAQDADASSADDAASSDTGNGEASDGETADGDAAGSDAAGDSADGSSGSGSQEFTGAVAEGGIESAGSNAVTLEQLKSGSLR